MNRTTIILISVFISVQLTGQNEITNRWELNTSVGLAYSGGSNIGPTIEVGMLRKFSSILAVGVFTNMMRTESIINDLSGESNGFDGSFTSRDIENLRNTDFFHRYDRNNHETIGIDLGLMMLGKKKLHAFIATGLNITKQSKSITQISNGGGGLPFVGYSYINRIEAAAYHFRIDLHYRLSHRIAIGIKSRYLSTADELGTYISITGKF